MSAHINICEWAAIKCKENCLVCRCEKSKLNDMSAALSATPPFTSYMYSALTTCSYIFWWFFLRVNESRQMHIPCLACYSHYLNTYTRIIWGHLYFFSWKRKQNKVSNVIMYHKQSRGETRKGAFPPSSPPKYLSVHLTRQKLLPDHSIASTLTLTEWRTCSTRQPVFCCLKKHRCFQAKPQL